jgi:hypothetical protein
MTRHRAAPLDRGARIVTATVWVLALVFALLGIGVAAFDSVVVGIMLLVGAVGVVALAVAFRPRQPVAYVTDETGVEVVRAGSRPRRFDGPIRSARRGRLGLRIAGDGGAYGYLGRYRADGSTVQAFVTSRDDVVLLEVGEGRLALSPSDPDGFIEDVSRHA